MRIGMEVVGRHGNILGTVTQISATSFEMARGLFLRREFSLPQTAIARVEPHRVVLSMSRAELEADKSRGHNGTTFERVYPADAVDDDVHIARAEV